MSTDLIIKEITYEASLKWWGLLANNNIHISTRFIKRRAFYNIDNDKFYIVKINDLTISIRLTYKKGVYVATNKLILSDEEILELISITKKLIKTNGLGYEYINIHCNNDINTINNLGYLATNKYKDNCFTHNIDYTLFDNPKITRRQIRRWLPISSVRKIENPEDIDKVNELFKNWLYTKNLDGENADMYGNLGMSKVRNNKEDYSLIGIFIGDVLIGYRAYRNINSETLFIMLENVINHKMPYIKSIEKSIENEYYKYYGKYDNSTERLIRNNAKSLCLYLYYEYGKKYNPNIKYYNIDSTGSKDENLYNYKKNNFEIETKALKIKIL